MNDDSDDGSPLTTRDSVLLGRILRGENEPMECDDAGDLTLGPESPPHGTIDLDADDLTISSPTHCKQPWFDLGATQSPQLFPAAYGQPSFSDWAVAGSVTSGLPLIDIAEPPSPDVVSQLPEPLQQQSAVNQLSPPQESSQKCKSALSSRESFETDADAFTSTSAFSPRSVPSPYPGSNLSPGSPPVLSGPASPVDGSGENCDFGRDYFWNFCSDDETSAAFPMDELHSPCESICDDELSEAETMEENLTEDVKNVPLYNGAPIDQWESLASILTFVQSEHISGAGLGRLLSLIDLHLPKPNKFLKTSTRLFKVLEGLDEPVKIHYFCSVCYKVRKSASDLCDTCKDENKCVLFFIQFPLEPQLRNKFARPHFVEDLKHKEKRTKKDINNIEDIYDGEVYKEAEKSFLESCINITLMWNTDGMQIFKSNSFSLWPFYLVINELSPRKRFQTENLLIAGVWGSVVKPHPNVYLPPIYEDLKTLEKGIDLKCHGEEETKKVVGRCIFGTCDAPARACFMNMKQHSGFYSCPVCLVKGEKPGKATVFPYEEEMSLRNLTQYHEHVKFAVENKVILSKTPYHEEMWCGIKGPTVLSSMVRNLLLSLAIDSMHCIYLGIMRALLHLWFDKEYKEESFSIFTKLKIVNSRLRNLAPPHFLQRVAQSIDKLIYWKATELRSFLFNLSLIILRDVLKPEFYNHFALFVQGVALLNSSSISEEDLVLSSLLLNQFVSQYASLYGAENMTHNLHMLLHLERCVRLLGPLWAVSCFQFEDMNNRLSNFINGTSHVGLQIHSNLTIITKLPLMVQNLKEGPAKDFCNSLLHKRYRLRVKEEISPGLFCVGVIRGVCEKNEWVHCLLTRLNLVSSSSVHLFSRLLKQKMLYVAKSYRQGARDSSYVKYTKSDRVLYGQIECFARVSCTCSNACSCECKHLAIIKPKPVSTVKIQGVHVSHLFKHNCTGDCKNVNNCDVVDVSDLITVLFKIDVENGMNFSVPLNNFELE